MFQGSLVALVTPMARSGQVDFDCLCNLIDWHVEQGSEGLVICGTTGESATLDKTEHAQVIQVAAEHAAGRLPVIAGTGSNSTAQTIDLSLAVGKSPIDAYLIVTPYYNKPTQEGLVQHFRAIADAVDKPVLLYNVPGRTAVDMLPETVGQVADHPGIIGIKEATGDVARVAAIKSVCGEAFRLYSGDDATARDFMLSGGHGVISVTSNVAPGLMAQMCHAATSDDPARAAEIDALLADLHRDLFVESNPIPVKWVLAKMGLIPDGIRLPMTWLSEDHQAAVETAMQKAGLV
jgi:4-hydroxy-tetrahydrodipicolinate synthase